MSREVRVGLGGGGGIGLFCSGPGQLRGSGRQLPASLVKSMQQGAN